MKNNIWFVLSGFFFAVLMAGLLAVSGIPSVEEKAVFDNTDITNAANPDTLFVRLIAGNTGTKMNAPAYNQVGIISDAMQTGEQTQIYALADESWWTVARAIQIKIRSFNDSVESSPITIANSSGAVTLFIQPDTTERGATDSTNYDKVLVVNK